MRSIHLLLPTLLIGPWACTPSAEPPATARAVSPSSSPPADVTSPADVTPPAARPQEAAPQPSAPLEAGPVKAEEPQLDALALSGGNPDVDHAFRAERQLEAGDLPGALKSLRRHLSGNPATTELLLQIGRLARGLRQPELARAALERAEAREPDAADVLLELGRLEMLVDRPEAASSWGRRFVKLHPDDGRAWNLLGRAAMASSAFQRAEFAFRRAVELSPTKGIYLNNLGLLYVMRKDGARAVSALEASLECFGEAAPRFVHNNLGLGRELHGDLAGAESAFQEALFVDPGYVNARVNLTRVREAIRASAVAAHEAQRAP